MKKLIVVLIVTAGFGACAGSPEAALRVPTDAGASTAWVWSNAEAEDWAIAVAADVDWAEAGVASINAGYLNLDRHAMSRADLFEAKFILLQWHERGKRRLVVSLREAAERGDTAEAASALERLARLGVSLSDREMEGAAALAGRAARTAVERAGGAATASRAAEILALYSAFSALCVSQGNRPRNDRLWQALPVGAAGLARANIQEGPALVPDIVPSRETDWTEQRILARPELRDYVRVPGENGGVVYRGVTFTPGDLLLVNLANPSEGLFTVFSAEDNFSYHLALYVELETEGLSVPCVYESYEHGTRIVPLCTYLAPSHTISVEVLHWTTPLPGSASRLSAGVMDELAREHGFNLWLNPANDEGGRSITCTTAVADVIGPVGFPLPESRTAIYPAVLPNLAVLGLEPQAFLSSGDFLSLPGLEAVGFIDNGLWSLYLASAAGNAWVRDAFSAGTLAPDGDGTYRFYRWGVDTVLSRAFPHRVILSLFGFNLDNFPSGPRETLALVLRMEEELDAGVARIESMLAEAPSFFVDRPGFSIHGFILDPRVMAAGDAEFAGIASWFGAVRED